ncbi:MAG: NAD(P)-dependent oxidoreductase [Bacteroidota bacterium]|nr:NAD(P)-dependent oxidoreductase [Bacteroidota bacterium]
MVQSYRKIGIIREGKQPADRRVPLTPDQCRKALDRFPDLDLVVQRSEVRAFKDQEYEAAGIKLVDQLDDRELILGVKEVPINDLLPGKSYLFFSHTIKKQPHNQKLLRAMLDKKIRLIDHELLTNAEGERLIAFGHWAGVVGAYNAFRAWQLIRGGPQLKPAHECHDLEELEEHLHAFPLPTDLRIVLTGGGRVGKGAMGVLERAGVQRVKPTEFLESDHKAPVYTILGSADLYERIDGKPFDRDAFHSDPSGHRSKFLPFARRAQIYLACHFWDPRGPKILSAQDLRDKPLSLQVIADISCDIGGPIDSTLRASTIADPFYGYDLSSGKEREAGSEGTITVMAVDNLPAELPRDASSAFGRDLLEKILPEFLGGDKSGMIARATIAENGKLTASYAHLEEYAHGDDPTKVNTI